MREGDPVSPLSRNGFSIDAALAVGVRLGDALDRQNDLLAAAARREYRRSISQLGSINAAASANAVRTMDGPSGGFEWHIRRISFGPTIGGTVSTQGTLLVGKGMGLQSSGVGAGGGQLVGTGGGSFVEITRTTVVPNALTFSSGQAVLRFPENLIVVWESGAGGPLVIDCDLEEMLVGHQVGEEA